MLDLKDILDKAIDARHYLHANPELSFKEFGTCLYISNILKDNNISYEIVADSGILVTIQGVKDDVDSCDTLIRADIDALPIVENSGYSHSSKNGAMHACGHDIHTSVLLGTLLYFSKNNHIFSGKIIGLFQPGEEESPGGASIVISSGVLNRFNIKRAFALHIAHDMPVGSFGLRKGLYMASTSEMRFTLKGSGGHAALPKNMTNPLLAMAQLIVKLKELEKNLNRDESPIIIAVGKVIANGSTNVIPSEVLMEGTIRAMSLDTKNIIKKEIKELASYLSLDSGVVIDVDFSDGYPPIFNNELLSERAKKILIESYGCDKVMNLDMRMTADDFGFISNLFPSFYYRLGVLKDGEISYPPHTAKFNADDNSIYYGIESMIKIVNESNLNSDISCE